MPIQSLIPDTFQTCFKTSDIEIGILSIMYDCPQEFLSFTRDMNAHVGCCNYSFLSSLYGADTGALDLQVLDRISKDHKINTRGTGFFSFFP